MKKIVMCKNQIEKFIYEIYLQEYFLFLCVRLDNRSPSEVNGKNAHILLSQCATKLLVYKTRF